MVRPQRLRPRGRARRFLSCSIVGDPVALGLVTSFNRPGGNVTGVAGVPGTIVAKQIEALHEMVPTATVIGCLLNPNNPKTESDAREAQEAARVLELELQILHAHNETEIERAFATLAQRRTGGLVVVPDGFFISRPDNRRRRHMIRRIPPSSRWPGA